MVFNGLSFFSPFTLLLEIIQPGDPGLDVLKTFKNSWKKVF